MVTVQLIVPEGRESEFIKVKAALQEALAKVSNSFARQITVCTLPGLMTIPYKGWVPDIREWKSIVATCTFPPSTSKSLLERCQKAIFNGLQQHLKVEHPEKRYEITIISLLQHSSYSRPPSESSSP